MNHKGESEGTVLATSRLVNVDEVSNPTDVVSVSRLVCDTMLDKFTRSASLLRLARYA